MRGLRTIVAASALAALGPAVLAIGAPHGGPGVHVRAPGVGVHVGAHGVGVRVGVAGVGVHVGGHHWGGPVGVGHYWGGYYHGWPHAHWGWGYRAYPGYGYYSGYSGYAAEPYYVARPVPDNPPPPPAPLGGVIMIFNPAENGVTLNYTLDGAAQTIPPGYSQQLPADRPWVIEFSRGGGLGLARYGLEPGTYTFTPTPAGWELYRSP